MDQSNPVEAETPTGENRREENLRMDFGRRVICPENEGVVQFLLQKRQELTEQPKGLSEKLDLTIHRAYFNICDSQNPITSLKDLSQIKGFGKWMLKLMQGHFKNDLQDSEAVNTNKKGKNAKAPGRYLPRKNSVAYALLITLFRETSSNKEFMRKQELIEAAEASGLSHVPIAPGKGKGKPSQFGSSPRDWYTGWNCMKTLITRGLVVKSSCPAKYMLTQEGKETAQECLLRSGLADSVGNFDESAHVQEDTSVLNSDSASADSLQELSTSSMDTHQHTMDIPPESLERFLAMGYSKDQVLNAFAEVLETSQRKDISALWPAVLCHLREDQVYSSHLASQPPLSDCYSKIAVHAATSVQEDLVSNQSRAKDIAFNGTPTKKLKSADFSRNSATLRACSLSEFPVNKSNACSLQEIMSILRNPPLSFGERFEDVYEVVLILDDREQFAIQGSRSRKIIQNVSSQFNVKIEVRRLPVGDGIWIARHKYLGNEYVLDFIVERKKVDDLHSSIRDNRYKDQKLKLLRCGVKKLIYLVEGDPNSCDAAESIKTACLTTEILEGFDVQRTTGLADTLKKYGYLTHAITNYYTSLPENNSIYAEVCPLFDDFVKSCQDLDKMTISDVFATQLMQVPQVTEEVAIAVLDMYPTLLSLTCAYACVDGDISAQEEMLSNRSNGVVSAAASRNIFKLVWGD